MPGRLSKFAPVACPHCDALYLGPTALHAKDCPRNPFCLHCGLEMLPGEKRARALPAHLDCQNEYLAHLDEEHA